MQTIRELWWLLTGRGRDIFNDDPSITWLREQADAAEHAADDTRRLIERERQRRVNIVEQAYLRGGRHGHSR